MDTSGLDLGDDVFSDLNDGIDLGATPSVRSGDTSSLFGSSHMKPRSRSRQSSIIGRNDPPIRPSSRAGNTPLMSSSFNIGAFRRRAREPSILGTGQKSRTDTTFTTQNHESESEEEDFAPDAESTPINNRRRTRGSMRQEHEASPSLPDLSATRSRKRKSDSVPENDDRPGKTSRTEESQPEESSDNDSELSSSPPARNLRPRMERPVTPTAEDFAAPPASSGSEDEGDYWPDIHDLAKRKRRPSVVDPLRGDNVSEASSPPSLTHSPNYAQAKTTRGRTRRESPPPLTTADLVKLLPRRRKGREAEVEYDTSNLGQDQDELSYARSTRRSNNSRTVLKDKAAPNTRSASRQGGNTQPRRSSNKENEGDGKEDEDEEEENETSTFEPLPDDTFDASSEPILSEELKKASKYFEEVDRLELSFEDDEDPAWLAEAR